MRRIWTPFLILGGLFGVLGFFQNCTSAVPFGSEDYFQTLVNSPEFPYEASLDQVAYMSCSEQEDIYNDGTFFTFRAGAVSDGGLRITPEYRDHIEKVDEEDVPYALQVSQSSARLKLQMAIRPISNLQLMFVDGDNGAEGAAGLDYSNFFPEMGDPDLVDLLWYGNPNDYVSYYPAAQFIEEARFEGEVQFMKSELMAGDLRNFFSSRGGLLTVTFAADGEIYPIGPGSLTDLEDLGDATLPTGDTGDLGVASTGDSSVQVANNDITRNVFGAAVRPQFKQPPKLLVPADPSLPVTETSPGSEIPSRVLSSIADVVIDERVRTRRMGAWTCPSEMAFMVVLPGDAVYQDDQSNTITRCRLDPDPVNPSPELQIIRQSLYQEDWYIDMRNRCVVPKSRSNVVAGSCYGKDSSETTHPINYDAFETGCGFSHIGQGNGLGLCPHFVSICYREP